MRLLRRIFRADDFCQTDETIEIPDAVFPQPETAEEEAADEEATQEEPVVDHEALLRERLTAELTRKIRAECSTQLRAEREKQQAAYETYLEKAHAKAGRLCEQAEADAAALVAAANAEADSIRKDAYEAGLAEGIAQSRDEMQAAIAGIGRELQQLQQDQLSYQEDYAKELRELSLEICEKLLCTKLDADDSLLLGLVRRAVKPIREAGWVKIDVSDKLGGYAQVLEKMIAQTRPSQKIEVETRRDAPKGTCVIQTADGVVVASVLTQLANIRTYLREFEKECEEADETEPREAVAGTPAAEYPS